MAKMQHKEIMTYNRVADLKRLDFIRKSLKEFLPRQGRILDVGCGNGIISLQLGKDGFTVKGIDVSSKAIQKAINNNPFSNVTFEVTDAEKLIAAGETFDAIICSEVLEHLSEPQHLLREFVSILKNNGLLIVTVPNGNGPREMLVTKPILNIRSKNNWLWKITLRLKSVLGYSGTTIQSEADNLDHVQFFTLKSLRKLSKDSGFEISTIRSSNFVDDIFPISLLSRRAKFIQKWDSKLADFLPITFTGGYLMIWEKIK